MNYLQVIQNKIMNTDELLRTLYQWRFRDKKIVFTNGCFDILHPGHIHLLTTARSLGDKLIFTFF